MNTRELLRLLRQNWWALLLTTLLAVAGGAAYLATAPPSYTATTTLFVSVTTNDGDAGEVVQGSSAAQLKVKSYVEVATSARVLGPVVEELDLETTPAQLASRITASTPAGTVLVDISVVDADPGRAAAIANSVGRHLTTVLVDDIETSRDGSTAPVRIETIDPAVAPGQPSAPRPALVLALACVVGVVAGLGLALLRDALDTRIHGPEDVAAMTEVPVVGTLAHDAEASRQPLVVQRAPRSPAAESYRTLRTNLQFLSLGTRARSVVVTSASPAEGKSTTSANLAISIAESGASVVLVDCDLRRPRTAELLGLEGAVGVSDALVGRAELDDLLQPWGGIGLSVLPAGSIPPNPSELLGSVGMQALLRDLEDRFEHVILDAPPVLPVTDATVLSRYAHATLVVSSTRRSTKPQLREALARLAHVDARVSGVVLTMVRRRGHGTSTDYSAYYGRTDTPPSRVRFRR